MIEVLVSCGILCIFCWFWYKSYTRNKIFNTQVKITQDMLDKFISINDLECMDFELENISEYVNIKKKYVDTSIVHQIGKELDTGYDFFHIKVKTGYDTLKHRHNFSDEFFYVLSGKINLSCTGKKDKLIGPGDYFYLNRGGFHCITAEEEAEFIVIAKPPMIVDK